MTQFAKKDANGIFIKESPEVKEPGTPDPPASDVDLDGLQDTVRLILFREIRNLAKASVLGLLAKEESQSLVNYAKLLTELKKAEAKAVAGLTDEELET